jgi:hypothetical protein
LKFNFWTNKSKFVLRKKRKIIVMENQNDKKTATKNFEIPKQTEI